MQMQAFAATFHINTFYVNKEIISQRDTSENNHFNYKSCVQVLEVFLAFVKSNNFIVNHKELK